ncbi:45487_t:CDS:1, partial [Gigaspora margarita]
TIVRIRENKNCGHARVTNKSRQQWNARKKLAIVTYLEKHPSQS